MSYSEYTTCSLDAIYAEGKHRGTNIGTWVDMPQAGDRCPTDDGTVEIVDTATLEEVMLFHAYTSESNNREYTPFEHIAEAINQRSDSEQAWEKYRAGIDAGIQENITKRIEAVADHWFDGEEA